VNTLSWIISGTSFVLGISIGALLRGWWDTRPPRQPHSPERKYKRSRRRELIGRTIAIVLVVCVLVFDGVVGVLLVATRHQVNAADKNRQQALDCQVHHNELTSRALARNNNAARVAIRSELQLWVRLRNGIKNQSLTSRTTVATLDRHIEDLKVRLRTIAANPYPPGGLCVQLIKEARRK
jgi:hypothetical protein